MSVRRCQPLADGVAAVARRLEHLETQVALLDRVRPLNLTSELARLTRAFEAGQKPPPSFVYGPRPVLAALRSELSSLSTSLAAGEPEQRLLSERAQELELEAALGEHVGEPEFDELARRRFPLPDQPAATRKLAELFASAPGSPNDAETAGILHDSGDPRDPHSLWSQLARLLEAERLAVRLEIVVGLVSLAAVANGVVRVRAGARLSERAARRIALHEVEGHVRPRVNAQLLGGVFSAGSARASQDEEGRAILLEERAGLLDAERRRELARRYFAVESLRDGAEFWDTVSLLGQRGAPLTAAVELASRVHRGGGLGRESIYLVGYQRVAAALGQRPELEQVLRSGRVTLDAAEVLLNGSIELDHDGNVI
ncbi:MAG TPA: tyrosine/phenylalanine carboxypeptidase domain-containing protein [Polyangiaceae bacterium]|nr:tyrosine/phenylalanine carboxypeptidase domain-containing protein [Polyangiaceae bacterium]